MAFFTRNTETLTGPVAFAMGAPKWRFELADLTGTALGDLTQARDRKITQQLVKPTTIEFTLDTFHPEVYDLLYNQHVYIKAYRENQLITTCETTALQVIGQGEERSIRVVATEAPWVMLMKRLIGKSTAGITMEDMDRSTMAQVIVFFVNLEATSKVEVGSVMSAGSTATATFTYKRAMEAITELGAPLNGFDWWFTPTEPSTGTVGRLNIAPIRGGYRPNAVFEYGTGRANAREYEWRIALGDRISRAYSLPPSYPKNSGLVVASSVDTATELNIGRREDLIESDLGDAAGDLRQALTDEAVSIRKNPKNVFLIQPAPNDDTGRVPQYLLDYDVGDIIEGRVQDQDILMLDALVRVYGVEVELDDLGNEQITLGLVQEE